MRDPHPLDELLKLLKYSTTHILVQKFFILIFVLLFFLLFVLPIMIGIVIIFAEVF